MASFLADHPRYPLADARVDPGAPPVPQSRTRFSELERSESAAHSPGSLRTGPQVGSPPRSRQPAPASLPSLHPAHCPRSPGRHPSLTVLRPTPPHQLRRLLEVPHLLALVAVGIPWCIFEFVYYGIQAYPTLAELSIRQLAAYVGDRYNGTFRRAR